MTEKILTKKKNGMLALAVTTLLYILSIATIIFSAVQDEAGNHGFVPLLVVGIIWACIGRGSRTSVLKYLSRRKLLC